MSANIVQTFRLEWRGIGITVAYRPRCYGGIIAHLELHADGRAPIPITGTGYRSHFIPCGEVEAHGGALAYVSAWLFEAEKQPEWCERQAKEQQMVLF
mgnify:CR=1 FL=1